jgi:cell division septation protein DedD
MASAPPSSLAASDDAAQIRRRALRRLVVAMAMLVAAFGTLLTYGRFTSPPTVTSSAKPAPIATAPAPAPTGPPAAPENIQTAKIEAPIGHRMQVGAFTSIQNAEALQRKLAEAGVPTSTETRVLIGPFHDRAEADRSMEAVMQLGLGAVVIPARP